MADERRARPPSPRRADGLQRARPGNKIRKRRPAGVSAGGSGQAKSQEAGKSKELRIITKAGRAGFARRAHQKGQERDSAG